jgi:Flp pilus assembly protein TadB
VILWLGIIVILVSYPLTKGTIDPRKYNYRPWQPKFVKELTDAKAKELGKRDGKLGVNLGILMILIGIASFILGLAGQGFYTLYLLNIFVIVVLLLIFYVYARAYKDSKGKA